MPRARSASLILAAVAFASLLGALPGAAQEARERVVIVNAVPEPSQRPVAAPLSAEELAGIAGGVAPAAECGTANRGQRATVGYQADYLFWKAL